MASRWLVLACVVIGLAGVPCALGWSDHALDHFEHGQLAKARMMPIKCQRYLADYFALDMLYHYPTIAQHLGVDKHQLARLQIARPHPYLDPEEFPNHFPFDLAEKAIENQLGKQRLHRLRQIYWQDKIQERFQLINWLLDSPLAAQEFDLADVHSKLQDLAKATKGDILKLNRLEKTKQLTRAQKQKQYRELIDRYENEQKKLVNDRVWKKFQTFCGKPFPFPATPPEGDLSPEVKKRLGLE